MFSKGKLKAELQLPGGACVQAGGPLTINVLLTNGSSKKVSSVRIHCVIAVTWRSSRGRTRLQRDQVAV